MIVNDRLDLAQLLAADGVHLGEGGVETARARGLFASAFVVRACHVPERVAEVDADIVLLSPILAERKGNLPLGVVGLATAAARLCAVNRASKLFALGGVDAEGAARCLAAGASGVAAIAGVFADESPLPLLRALGIERFVPG